MKGKQRFGIVLLIVSLTLSACTNIPTIKRTTENQPVNVSSPKMELRETAQTQPQPQTGQTQAQYDSATLMIYMVGSDLESENGLASVDIEEMIDSTYDKENLTVLICTGGSSYWWANDIPNDSCTIYKVDDWGIEKLHTLKNTNMAVADTLTEFLDYGYENYKSDSYNLILWNHGAGAVLGYGADENYQFDSLSMQEMSKALDSSIVCEEKGFEWIGFDACLMGMIEVADVFQDYSNYLIASEELEAGNGWDYSFLNRYSKDKLFVGEKAGACITESYEKQFEEIYDYTPDYTLACLDLSKTDEVINALDSLVKEAGKSLAEGNYSRIARCRDSAKSFGRISNYSFYDTVDLYDLSTKLQDMYPDFALELQGSLNNFITDYVSNVPRSCGVSVYFPYENKEYANQWLEEYERIGFSEEYTSFIRDFTTVLSGEALASWEDIAEVAPIEDTTTAGQYYIQLTKDQLANYSSAKYSIWEEDSEDSYICWIMSSDVSLSKDGKLSSGFEGKRFYIGDSSGNKLLCCAIEIDRNEESTKFAVPIIIWKNSTPTVAYVHIRVDEEYPEGKIIGIYNSLDEDASLFPSKQTIELKEGDIISPYFFARNIEFREDGSVAPFEEWKSTSGIGADFKLAGDLKISIQESKESTELCCLFQVKDTQGNQYFTNPVYLN